MLDEKSIAERMQKSVDTLRKDLSKVRTGIASPAILDNVMVDYYGTKTPLPQVAAVSVPEPRTLAIKPWEKNLLQVIEKAILASNLGMNPMNDGTYIRLNMPILTADRRKELAKAARGIGEEAKVAVRNIRKDENEQTKKNAKDERLPEDELKHELEKIQQLTDKFIAIIDQILDDKEKDILTVLVPSPKTLRFEHARLPTPSTAHRRHHGRQRPLGAPTAPAARGRPQCRRGGGAQHGGNGGAHPPSRPDPVRFLGGELEAAPGAGS